MPLLTDLWTYGLPTLIVLTVLVFFHELGHYWVARRNGVRVEVFSIGLGPELFGRTDRAGTRWRVSLIPFGGYVRFLGDADAASRPGDIGGLTPEQRAVSFPAKRLGQRAAIVAAGPIANFLLAMVLLFLLLMAGGHPLPPPWVGSVQEDSAAAAAGVQPGDHVRAIDGTTVDRFAEIAPLVQVSAGAPVTVALDRDGETLNLTITPRLVHDTDASGDPVDVYRLGIGPDAGPYGPLQSLRMAVTETGALGWLTLKSLAQIVVGHRSTGEIGGPLRIAQISGEVAQEGPFALGWFIAILSINLGLINLLPVPMLDGGHLLFYAVEAVRGRPLGERAQEYGFRIGLALVLTLMVFATWNDLVQMRVIAFLQGLIS